MKVFIDPTYTRPDTKGDGGIRRVSEAQHKYLKDFGIETTPNPDEANVIANHGAALTYRNGIPLVNHCHGLYWARYTWDSWADDVNARVIQSMKFSVAHTAPSQWVADAITRGMLINPEVIYHGIDIENFNVRKERQDYILWNKARTDPVSDPGDMNKVAKLLPSRRFVSTFGVPGRNVEITGSISFEKMQNLVSMAGIYLATTRETFGIGTLEAMAYGVPVVGWDFGGQSEIIIDGETGYLVTPGDYNGLAVAIEKAFKNRKKIGYNARKDAEERWGWEKRIQQYAELYTKVYQNWYTIRPKVSVIVTAYNLDRYLEACLESVQGQTLKSFECIIVDDCSTDGTEKTGHDWERKDRRFIYKKTPRNLKLSGARNFGVQASTGKYIIMLDADDMLDRNALETLSGELDKYSDVHVAYGHLDTVNEAGEERKRNNWPFNSYDWREQMAHLNQLPYSSMIRREAFENCGGYRERAWRAEDANLWCRMTSMGYVARKVTNASTLVYRMRSDSKSKGEPGDGDWTAWFPWRIAGSHREAKEALPKIRSLSVPDPDIVPFGAEGIPPNGRKAWPVHDRSYPTVSVIIPVGPGHESFVIDAVESVMAQTYPEWEVIVVNDTGKKWSKNFPNPLSGAPYAKVIETNMVGAGAARNAGAKISKADLLLFLDADDMLLPTALEVMLSYYETNKGIIYCDWLRSDSDPTKPLELYEQDEFVCGAVLKKLRHSVVALIPKKNHNMINGFDEKMKGWEDWDYFIGLQTTGLCSYRAPHPLFVYRFYAGKRRQQSFDNRKELLQYIRTKYSDYYERRKPMPCSTCPGAKKPRAVKKSTSQSVLPQQTIIEEGVSNINVEYLGPHIGPVTIKGSVSGKSYRFGRQESTRVVSVDSRDAESLLGRTTGGKPLFRKV